MRRCDENIDVSSTEPQHPRMRRSRMWTTSSVLLRTAPAKDALIQDIGCAKTRVLHGRSVCAHPCSHAQGDLLLRTHAHVCVSSG